jgi:hypothetical protein
MNADFMEALLPRYVDMMRLKHQMVWIKAGSSAAEMGNII